MNNEKTAADITAESVRIDHQVKTYGPKIFTENGSTYRITAQVRYDDSCHNGRNSFSITGTIDRKAGSGHWTTTCGGCIHEDIARRFPELAPCIKWHLCGSDAPMYYAENTVYFAGDKDCWGLRKGEKRQIRNGRSGLPAWRLTTPEGKTARVEGVPQYVDAETAPLSPVPGLVYSPWCRAGEGKERELDAARRSAMWPEATDEELSADPDTLKAALLERLPGLLAAFRADVEKLGFGW